MKRDNDLAKLNPAFRAKLEKILGNLRDSGHTPVFLEGLRTVARQAHLYAQGRTRAGKIVTKADGIDRKSEHQERAPGDGGRAADIAFRHSEQVACSCKDRSARICWDGGSAAYRMLGYLAEREDLRWGGRFGVKGEPRTVSPLRTTKVGWDPGHVELA